MKEMQFSLHFFTTQTIMLYEMLWTWLNLLLCSTFVKRVPVLNIPPVFHIKIWHIERHFSESLNGWFSYKGIIYLISDLYIIWKYKRNIFKAWFGRYSFLQNICIDIIKQTTIPFFYIKLKKYLHDFIHSYSRTIRHKNKNAGSRRGLSYIVPFCLDYTSSKSCTNAFLKSTTELNPSTMEMLHRLNGM